jgi:pilus assembly protein CpaC
VTARLSRIAKLWWAVTLVAFAQPALAGASDIALESGTHMRMSFDKPIKRIAIGSPEIVEAKMTERTEVILLGKTPGRTSILFWIEGDAAPLEQVVLVSQKVGALDAEYQKDPAFSRVRVDSGGKTVTLKGFVATAEDHHRALRLAKDHVENVIDDLKVLQQQMISVEVRFAAMSVNTLKKLGFDFRFLGGGFQLATTGPNSVSGFGFTSGVGLDLATGLPISEAFNLLVAGPKADLMGILSALSGTRLAQILAEPTLVVRSGENAEFVSGGEIPVPVPQAQGAIGIEYRRFGIQLRVSATALTPERIALRVAPEVSELDFSRAVTIGGTQVPAIASRTADTTIELGSGKSFILAGLMSSTQSDSEQLIPLLGQIPIIGPFFKRVDNARERQELIIVVTPRLVNPMELTQLPSPPGSEMKNYDPSLGESLLGTDSLQEQIVSHGLMP